MNTLLTHATATILKKNSNYSLLADRGGVDVVLEGGHPGVRPGPTREPAAGHHQH